MQILFDIEASIKRYMFIKLLSTYDFIKIQDLGKKYAFLVGTVHLSFLRHIHDWEHLKGSSYLLVMGFFLSYA